MKNYLKTILNISLGVILLGASPAFAQRQMEKLGRGVVVLHSATSQAYIGWRLFVTDPTDIGFNVYRSANGAAGVKINLSGVISNTTDFLDTTANFSISNAWYVRPVIGGIEQSPSGTYGLAANSPVRQYISLPLQPVAGGLFPPYDVKFSWVGDFDGDGEYDYLVDRLSTTTESNQYLQAYKRDGTLLWQMDMGYNSTNQYAHEPSASAISVGDKDNVTVYDLDGDGRAEVCVRTARGVVLPNSTVISGPDDTTQYLSILDGLSGAELARTTISNAVFAEGPLNSRFGIMYCDGKRPSLMIEGENRTGGGNFNREAMAYDFRDGQLTRRWFVTPAPGFNESWGHQIRIMDVNHDGIDDLIEVGSVKNGATGVPLFGTELIHGDRFHCTDIDPERPGLEMFSIQQNNSTLLATALIDMTSGAFIKKWYSGTVTDVGRGTTFDMTPTTRGGELFSTQPGIFDAKGTQIYANNIWPPEALWWDGDILRELEDGAGSGALSPVIDKFNPTTGVSDRVYSLYNEDGGCHQAYGGRAAIWGDLFGDWREEFMVVSDDYNSVRIYSTKIQATNRIYCLMQNPSYRCQTTSRGYYQTSDVDYYLGNDMPAIPIPPVSDAALVWRGNSGNVWDENSTASWFTNNLWVSNNTPTTFASGTTVLFDLSGSNSTAITISGNLTPGDVRIHSPKAYTFDSSAGDLTGSMKLTKAGAGKLTLLGTNTYTGNTLIGEGPFVVSGSLPNSPITVRGGVWLDGRLGGTGVIGSTVRFEEGAGFSAGAGTNSPGTLTVVSNVTFTGRTLSDFDLSDNPLGVNDLVIINGNLTLQGTNKLVINKLNSTLPPGVYPLINYSGALSGNLNNLAVSGLPGVPVALTNPPGQIALVVKSYRAPATINWTGGSSGNVWDLLSTSNFLNSAVKDVFAPGDTVRFDSIGTSNLTATLVGDLNAAAVIVDSTANYTLAGSGAIIGSASLTKTNSGTLTISALNNSYTGRTVIGGGTVVVSELDAAGYPSPLGAPNTSPTNLVFFGSPTLRITGESYTDRGMTLNTGTNTVEISNSSDQLTIAGLITGGGAFQKTGSGAIAVNGSNNYSGVTIISAGTISLGGDTANEYGFGANGTGTVILNAGTINMFDNSGSYNSCSWTLTVPTGASGTLNADSRVDYYGALTGGGTLTFKTPYVRTTLFGNWSAFTGQINVTTDDDGGDFRISNGNGYANATINLAPLVNAYHLSGSAVSIGALSGSAASLLTGSTPWTVGSKNTDATFDGTISSGSITKTGTGRWTITGPNTYTGTTTVSGGTLLVNGNNSAATGAVTVNSSGTLGGTGTIGGAVSVTGKLAPGENGIGTLICNSSVTLNAAGTTIIELNKSNGTRDLLDGNATITYGGTLQVTNLAGAFALNDSFKIFDAVTYAGAFNNFVLPSLNIGLAWSTSGLITNGTINVVSNGIVPPAPSAPTNLVALAVSFSQINLSWSDTSTNEDGFYIEASADGVNFTQIASVGSGITAYSDTGLNAGTLRYYRVRASNVGGFSAYSNIASATTFPPLTWRGDGAGNVWDIATTSNWRSNGIVSTYIDGVSVLFDASGSNNTAVNLSTTLSPAAITVNASKNYTFGGNGPLAGAMTLVKAGTGSLTLSTTNSFSGGIVISNGSVIIGNIEANNKAFGSSVITFAGGTLQFNGYGGNVGTGWGGCTNTLNVPTGLTGTMLLPPRWGYSAPFTSPLIGGGTLNVTVDYVRDYFSGNWSSFTGLINVSPRSGTGDFRIDNDFDYANAAFYLNNGVNFYTQFGNNQTIDIGELGGNSGAYIGAGSLATSNPHWRIGGRNTDSIYAGTFADSGVTVFTKLGTGKLTLSGNNTYSGVTTISGGTLQFGNGGTTGSLPTNNIVNNATLIFNRSDNLSDAGVISGSGTVIQDGDGAMTFAKSHTYSGQTFIYSGKLALTGNGSIANSSINISSGALLDVSGRTGGNMTLASGKTLSGNGSVNGSFILASGAKLTPGNSVGSLTFSNNLTLNSGSTTTMELTKSPNSNDRVNVTGTLTLGGTLTVTNISANAFTAGDSFQLFNALTTSGTFSSMTLPPLSSGLAWNTSALISSGTISVIVAAPKSVVWKGDGAANVWDINTTANWLDTNSLPVFFANYDNVTINDTGSNNVPIVLNTTVQPASVTVNATKSYVLTGNGGIGGTNSLTKSGSGNFTLSTTNNYAGATTISAGSLIVANPGAGLKNRWSFNNSLADSVGGQNATVVDVGANNTTLSATQITLSGGAQASSDYVSLGGNVLPNGTTPVSIELWATPLSVQNWSRIFDFGSSTTEYVTMSWTRTTVSTQDRIEWTDTAGTTTSDDTCQLYTLGTEFHIAMVIEPGAGAGGTTRVTWYRAASTNSAIGAARGTFNTTNTLAILNDVNCWLGRSQWPDNTANASYNEVRVWNRALTAGDLQALHTSGADAVFGAGLPNVTTVNLSGATAKLDLQNSAQTIASLTGVTSSEVKLTAANLNVGGDNSSTTFAGFFSGTNGFTKAGTGTLTLSGNSTHTGTTTVNAGTLLVHGNNSAANGVVTVASGATLGGNGTLGGATTIQAGGTLAPGASIGAITFTNTLALSGTTVMEISHTPLTNDVVNKTGAMTYGGALQVTNISGTLAAGDSFKLFNAPSYTGSFTSITLPTLTSGLVWTTNTLNTAGTISVNSAVSTTPTNITFSVVGNNLTLSWPASHTGWTLQAQTNSIDAGLDAMWFSVAGSTATNSMTFPVNLANPTVFYRLKYP